MATLKQKEQTIAERRETEEHQEFMDNDFNKIDRLFAKDKVHSITKVDNSDKLRVSLLEKDEYDEPIDLSLSTKSVRDVLTTLTRAGFFVFEVKSFKNKKGEKIPYMKLSLHPDSYHLIKNGNKKNEMNSKLIQAMDLLNDPKLVKNALTNGKSSTVPSETPKDKEDE